MSTELALIAAVAALAVAVTGLALVAGAHGRAIQRLQAAPGVRDELAALGVTPDELRAVAQWFRPKPRGARGRFVSAGAEGKIGPGPYVGAGDATAGESQAAHVAEARG